MGIQIEKTFTIDASRDAVWGFLTDPERVARCLPGTSISEKIDERTYKGTTSLKVGPIAASYKGKMTFERLDAAAGEADMKASAQDVSGRGGAEMRMSSRVVALDSGGTEVTVRSEVNVMGLLAQLGRGMIQDVSDVLFDQFTSAMAAELSSAAPTAAGAAPEEASTDPVAAPEPAGAGEEPAEGGVIDPQLATRPVAVAEPAPSGHGEDREPTSGASETAAPPPPTPTAAEQSFDATDLGKEVARRALKRRLTSPVVWLGLTLLVLLLAWLLIR